MANIILIKSKIIAFVFSKYVDYCKNENNIDMRSNGELNFIKKNIHKLNIVFDVGANIGEWTMAIKNIKRGVTVHAFEPCKKTYGKLCFNLSNVPNLFLNKIAIGDKKGSLEMFVYEDGAGINSF